MKPKNLLIVVAFIFLDQIAFTQTSDLRYSKVFYENSGSFHVSGTTWAGEDSLLLISGGSDMYYESAGAVHLFDVGGEMIWSKKLVLQGHNIQPTDIVNSMDGNFFITATLFSYEPPIADDILLIKMDKSGELIWARRLSDARYLHSSGMSLTDDGGVLITGSVYENPTSSSTGLILIKYDSQGVLLFSKSFFYENVHITGISVASLDNEDIIVGGQYKANGEYVSQIGIMQFSSAGELIRAKKINFEDQGNSEFIDLISVDSGYYFFGNIGGSPGSSLVYMDMNSNIIWAKSIGFRSFERSYYYEHQQINRDVSGEHLLLCSGGGFVKADLDGNPVWAQFSEMITFEAVSLSDEGYLFIGLGPILLVKEVMEPHTGFIRTNEIGEALSCSYGYPVESFEYTLVSEDFTVESSDFGTASAISLDYMFYELNSNDECVSIIGNTNENNTGKPDLQIFPNPGKGPFRMMSEDINPGHFASLAVYNINGKLVYAKEASWNELQLLDIELQAGIYFIKVSVEDKVFTAKLVVN
ncbi:MAG: hypothetical protein PWQ54_1601 [Bacteroidales bacterium]|nr:hypothetical protein [Bacteroidales bacterium]